MWTRDLVAIAITLGITIATSVPLGAYAARVFQGERTWLDPLVGPIERLLLRLLRVDARDTQAWTAYARSLLRLEHGDVARGLAIVTPQGWLPLNPDAHRRTWTPTLAFNTASSFVTNTNLQHYSGETGLSTCRRWRWSRSCSSSAPATGMAAIAAIIRALGGSRLTRRPLLRGCDARQRARPAAAVARGRRVGLWQGVP